MARIRQQEFQTRVTAKDETKAELDKAGKQVKAYGRKSESVGKRMSDAWKKHWAAFAAGAYAAIRTVQAALRQMDQAADWLAQIRAIDALGKQYEETGIQIVEAVQKASNGLLSLRESADLAAIGMERGLDPSSINRFVAAAENMNDLTGDSIPEAFNRLIRAAERGNERYLIQLGLQVDLNKAYEQYAEDIGVSVEQLDTQQQMQARVNAVLDATEEKYGSLGNESETLADKLQRTRRVMEDAQLGFGLLSLWSTNIFMTFIMTVAQGWAKLAGHATTALDAIRKEVSDNIDYYEQRNENFVDRMHLGMHRAMQRVVGEHKEGTDAMSDNFFRFAEEMEKGVAAYMEGIRDPKGWLEAQMTATQSLLQINDAVLDSEEVIIESNERIAEDRREHNLEYQLELETMEHLKMEQYERLAEREIEHIQSMTENQIAYLLSEGSRQEAQTAMMHSDYSRRAQMIKNYYNEMIAESVDYYEIMALEMEKDRELHELNAEMKAEADRNYSQAAKDVMFDMFATFAEQNRTFFELWKAIQIAETIISTITAAQEAFRAMVGIPIVGPALAVAAAAAALAAGYARVDQIRSQQFPKKHSGGYIDGPGEEPIYRLQRGEGVLSRTGMSALDRLNQGERLADGSVDVTFHVNTFDGKSFENYLVSNRHSISRAIGASIRNNEGRF